METQLTKTIEKIRLLNKLGEPVIFMITGNNSAGKTTLTRRLIQTLPFYQSINLGLASKMIRFFRPELEACELENFDHNEASQLFKNMMTFMIDSYHRTGVNVLFDGVQIDTKQLLRVNAVLGGVILEMPQDVAIQRGQFPETHFKRSLTTLKQIGYEKNEKFNLIDNSGSMENTFSKTIDHLNGLLDNKLSVL